MLAKKIMESVCADGRSLLCKVFTVLGNRSPVSWVKVILGTFGDPTTQQSSAYLVFHVSICSQRLQEQTRYLHLRTSSFYPSTTSAHTYHCFKLHRNDDVFYHGKLHIINKVLSSLWCRVIHTANSPLLFFCGDEEEVVLLAPPLTATPPYMPTRPTTVLSSAYFTTVLLWCSRVYRECRSGGSARGPVGSWC